MAASTVVLIAKDPGSRPVKTRLAASIGVDAATAVARAMLADTLAALSASAARRHVVALDGDDASWVPAFFEIVAQRGTGLGERLACAFEDVDEPAFLVGSDTPQLTPGLVDAGLAAVAHGRAVLGPAADGGYWGIGLAQPQRHCFVGVPMSTPLTLARTRLRLRSLGLDEVELPTLRDVDDLAALHAVAAGGPGSETRRCAATYARVGARA